MYMEDIPCYQDSPFNYFRSQKSNKNGLITPHRIMKSPNKVFVEISFMLGAITFIRRYSKVRRKGKEKEKRVIYRHGLWFSRAYPLTMYYERNLYTLARANIFLLPLFCNCSAFLIDDWDLVSGTGWEKWDLFQRSSSHVARTASFDGLGGLVFVLLSFFQLQYHSELDVY